jgi:hypothetical protein
MVAGTMEAVAASRRAYSIRLHPKIDQKAGYGQDVAYPE